MFAKLKDNICTSLEIPQDVICGFACRLLFLYEGKTLQKL